MKKHFFPIVIIICILLFVSGCINNSGNQTYNSNGIIFNYPNGWYKTPGEGNVNVFDLNIPVKVTVGDNANKETGMLVLLSNNTTYQEILTSIKAGILKHGVLISESNVTIDSAPAREFDYNTTLSDGTVKKERLILFEKNNSTYILIFTALPQDFNGQQTNFQMIQNSFKVQ